MREASRRGRGGGRGAGRSRPRASLLLGAAFLLTLSLLAACAPRKPAPPEAAGDPLVWALADGGTRFFVAGPEGLQPLAGGPGKPGSSGGAAGPEGGAAGDAEGRAVGDVPGDAPEILLAAASAAGDGRPAASSGQPAGAATAAGPADAGVAEPPLAAFALEGWGAAFLELDPGASTLRLSQLPLPELAGLKLGGLWRDETAFLLASFRDPFAEESDAAAGSAAPKAVAGTGSGPASSGSAAPGTGPLASGPASSGSAAARAAGTGSGPASKGAVYRLGLRGLAALDLPPLGGLGPGYELFAFLPRPGGAGAWLAQFRDSTGPRSRSLWASYPSLGGPGRLIAREDFEAALAPRSLAEAPPALRAALEALGPGRPESALLSLSGGGEAAGWYAWGGDPAAGRELQASMDEAGDCLLLAPGGEAVLVMAGASPRRLDLAPPLDGAHLEACALLDLRGRAGTKAPPFLIAAVWRGPGSAGILLAPALE